MSISTNQFPHTTQTDNIAIIPFFKVAIDPLQYILNADFAGLHAGASGQLHQVTYAGEVLYMWLARPQPAYDRIMPALHHTR